MNLESKYLKSLRKSKQNTFQSTSINFDYATPTAKDKLFFYPLNPKDLYINRILTNSDKVTCNPPLGKTIYFDQEFDNKKATQKFSKKSNEIHNEVNKNEHILINFNHYIKKGNNQKKNE